MVDAGSSSRAAHPAIFRKPGGAERDPTAHARRQRRLSVALGIGVPVGLLILWQVAGVNGWVDRLYYPPPSDIFAETRKVFRSEPGGHYGADVWVSVKRVLWGYLFGTLFALLLGFVMGMNRWARAALEPMLTALYTVPKLALIGVFLLLFRIGERPIYVLIAVTVFFFVWIQTMAAVMGVQESYREAARSFGARRWQMFRHVILPASLPIVFVGLRIAAGVAVLTMIGVEFVYTPVPHGVGYRINNARQVFDPPEAYVGLVIAALMGVIFSEAIRRLGRGLTRWAPKDSAVN